MTTTASFAATAYFAALDASAAVRSKRSVWRQFFQAVIQGPTRGIQDEVADYLGRHQHDLSPALRIELERCRFFF
jgi:hypothetical protein